MYPEDYAEFPGFDADATLRRWNLYGYIDARDGAQAVVWFLVALCALSTLAAAVPGPKPLDMRYGFLFSGNLAGSGSARVEKDGTLVVTFEFNDRGRGSNITSRYRLDAQGLPVSLETTGNNYWKSPVSETFQRTGNRVTWKNASENVSREVQGPAFYSSLNATPQENLVLARALLATPDHRLPLLPSGEARLTFGSSELLQGIDFVAVTIVLQ